MSVAAQTLAPPSKTLMFLEGRALHELGAFIGALPLLSLAPRGDGHPVLVLPGLVASDVSTRPLRTFLNPVLIGCVVVLIGLYALRAPPLVRAAPVAVIVALFLLEVGGPYLAETRRGGTPWHAHHIAERYGLFTIIVLGECVLGATNAVAGVVEVRGWSWDVMWVGAGSTASLASEACICAGVPSNRRPQPAPNSVSPQNTAPVPQRLGP